MRLALLLGWGMTTLWLLPSQVLAQEEGTKKTTLGGYGEIHFSNVTGANTPPEVTFARFVLYLAHSFNDRVAFRSELEVEDAKIEGGKLGGEVALEQAYLDYSFGAPATVRTGLVLIPVGIINEIHEPTTFNGVTRPEFDHDVLPTTWREIGLGSIGQVPVGSGLSYRIYLINGLNAAGFTGAEGIRGGRQEGQVASFANPSFTGRLEWSRPGVKLGGSFWYGGSANQNPAIGTGAFAAPVFLLSADARVNWGNLALRGVIANITIGDAQQINQAYGLDVGSRIAGGYAEAAYDVLGLIARNSRAALSAFVRYEQFNTQASVPSGTAQDASLARQVTTFGLTFKPIPNVVFKGDYQLLRNRADLNEAEVFRLGVGYQF